MVAKLGGVQSRPRACRRDLGTCSPDLGTCGPDLATCLPEARTCGPAPGTCVRVVGTCFAGTWDLRAWCTCARVVRWVGATLGRGLVRTGFGSVVGRSGLPVVPGRRGRLGLGGARCSGPVRLFVVRGRSRRGAGCTGGPVCGLRPSRVPRSRSGVKCHCLLRGERGGAQFG